MRSGTRARTRAKTKTVVVRSLIVATALTFVCAPAAFAQAPNNNNSNNGRDPGAADVLFREGRKAMQAGNAAAACPKFHESYRLDPAPGTLLNLGECEEKQGHLAAAWQFFREAEQRLGQDDRSKIAKERWEALEARLAFVTFKLPPGARADAKVVRDDVELSSASLGVALPLDPGPHVVRVRAPGTAETKVEIALKSGERRDVVLEIGAPSNNSSTARASNGSSSDGSAEEKTNVLPYVAFSVAAAGLITMGIGAWQVLDAKSVVDKQCINGQCEQAGLDAADNGKIFSVVATVGAVFMVAGAAAGVVLLIKSPKKTAAVGAGPMATGFGLSASHAF